MRSTLDELKNLKIKKLTPLEHQLLIIKFFRNPNNRGILIWHSLGSGKTLTSLLAAAYLHDKFKKPVFVITPTSLVENYIKEMDKYGIYIPGIVIQSYGNVVNQWHNNEGLCNDKIVIIDEAHNLDGPSERANVLTKCARSAFKLVLLTATPIKNQVQEAANLFYALNERSKEYYKNLLTDIANGDTSRLSKLRCKISYYKNENKEDYPTFTEHEVKIHMTNEYYNQYKKIEQGILYNIPDTFKNSKDLTAFLNGIRRAVNKLDNISPKMDWVIDKIKLEQAEGKKILVYSAWKEVGLNELKKYITDYCEIHGSLTKKGRQMMVNKFNDGRCNTLLITAAGSEGLDLKGVRTVIVIDKHWNQTRIDQVVGRAIRYKSHTHLPISERHVDIWYPILLKPDTWWIRWTDWIPSADQILTDITERKNKLAINFYKNLQKMSIENNDCF